MINKVFIIIFIKYSNFINIFFLKLIFKLFKYIKINNYTIKQFDN